MSATKTAVLFPGQGAHDCNMLDGVVASKRFAERYELVCQVLRSDPLKELRNKNIHFLNQNKVSSLLTILVSSLSLDLYLEKEREIPSYYTGYSVGQWTSLYAAGAFPFETLIEIVSARADFMDECFKTNQGAMMAFIGVRESVLEEYLESIRKQGHFIVISNYNCLGQYSLAGTKEAIEIAYGNADLLNPRKTVILPVQGAWHCQLLEPAEKAFASYLEPFHFSPLTVPVLDMKTGDFFPDTIECMKPLLAAPVSHPVFWDKGIKHLIQEGCEEFVEVGYGNVLTKFGFFIDRDKIHRSFYTV